MARQLNKQALANTEFENSARHGSGCWQVYDTDFFNYKQRFGASRLVQVGDWRVWLKVTGALQVGDADWDSEEKAEKGLEALRALGRQLGQGRILFQTHPGSRVDQLLSTQYSGFTSWRVGHLWLDGKSGPLNFRCNFGDLDTF